MVAKRETHQLYLSNLWAKTKPGSATPKNCSQENMEGRGHREHRKTLSLSGAGKLVKSRSKTKQSLGGARITEGTIGARKQEVGERQRNHKPNQSN